MGRRAMLSCEITSALQESPGGSGPEAPPAAPAGLLGLQPRMETGRSRASGGAGSHPRSSVPG